MYSNIRRGVLATGLAFSAFFAVACSSADNAPTASSDSSQTPSSQSSPQSPTGMANDPAANLVGLGCADYAKANPNGAGSVAGMAQDPVAVAASNNPLLTTLVKAVSGQLNPQVNLVDTLNGSEFTVFAPVDSAFAKIDPGTIDALKTNSDQLTKILTYHVVSGQISPDKIVGTQITVEKGTVTVTGSGNDLKVNNANVICGGVKTSNATVYLIDTVLMPPAN